MEAAMPVTLSCPSCDRKLRVPEDLLGKRVKCPNCRNAIAAEDPNAEVNVDVVEDDEPRARRPAERYRRGTRRKEFRRNRALPAQTLQQLTHGAGDEAQAARDPAGTLPLMRPLDNELTHGHGNGMWHERSSLKVCSTRMPMALGFLVDCPGQTSRQDGAAKRVSGLSGKTSVGIKRETHMSGDGEACDRLEVVWEVPQSSCSDVGWGLLIEGGPRQVPQICLRPPVDVIAPSKAWERRTRCKEAF